MGWLGGGSFLGTGKGREGRGVEGLTLKINALLGVCVCVWFCGWARVTFQF